MTIIPLPQHIIDASRVHSVLVNGVNTKSEISKYRHKRGLTQKQLSEATGIPLGVLQGYEQKSRQISRERAEIISEYLNAPFNKIYYTYKSK